MDLARESIVFIKPLVNRFLVSILVLMDLAREFFWFPNLTIVPNCFNPCFNGSCSRIFGNQKTTGRVIQVSILVLMDLAREYSATKTNTHTQKVSILVLMDLARE